MKVTCDKCQISFYPMIKEENKQVGKQNITRTFLVCPNCGKQYDSYYDNQKTLILKKQIRKAFANASVETNETNKERILKGIEKKKKQLKKEERILQTLYNKGEQIQMEQMENRIHRTITQTITIHSRTTTQVSRQVHSRTVMLMLKK